MELILQKENEDGSADFDMKLTNIEVQQLVRVGLIEVLTRAVKEGEKYECREDGMGDTRSGEVGCKDGPCEQPCKSGQCRNCSKAA